MPDLLLGELTPVLLRDVWPDESASFTPWLARPENLKRLGDTLGIELETEEEEAAVGPFSADILCKDTADGSWVVIENQIEKTDHRHLGQILTYSAGLGAKTMIWVAAKFTDEHRAALDWLNDNTGEDISFFGLEIEVWKIGNSAPAPKFNIVCKPNDWSKAVKTAAAGGDGVISPHKQLQFEFWTAFKAYVMENSNLHPQKPSSRHWLTLKIGHSAFHVAAITSAWNSVSHKFDVPEVRVDFTMKPPKAKNHFAQIEAQKDAMQAQIDLPLVWHNPDDSKSCKIYVRRDGDFTDRENWPELFAWLLKYFVRFDAVFRPIVKSL
jgi:hypothetical protein